MADDSDHPPGAHQDGTRDYSSQIATFKKNNRQILNTFPIPPDFATFWRQAVAASRPRAGMSHHDFDAIDRAAQDAEAGRVIKPVLRMGKNGGTR